jgi:hypothetical protein
MIDEETTFILFGYTSDILKPYSTKKVLRVCNICKDERLIKYGRCTNLCKSCSKKGNKNPMFGKHLTNKTKRKMSKAKQGMYTGDKSNMFGKTGDKNPTWKGGKKLAQARANTKRRKLFGFIPHNLQQKDFHGHHLDFNHVIFIPKELHTSIYHSVTKNINMDIINNLVCDWYLKYQIQQKN